jgi:hypothetical protein
MNDDLLEFLMSDAEAACDGDKDKMALYLAGVAVGVLDGSWTVISSGFVRKNSELVPWPKAVPQAVLTTNEIIEGLDNGD